MTLKESLSSIAHLTCKASCLVDNPFSEAKHPVPTRSVVCLGYLTSQQPMPTAPTVAAYTEGLAGVPPTLGWDTWS